MAGLARRASARMPAGRACPASWCAPLAGYPTSNQTSTRRVAPDPALHAVPEDAHEGVFEVIDVGDAGSGVLHAGPPPLADLTPGEQVEAPPSRPRDDGLDPPRRVGCHHRTPAVPAPQAPDRYEGRPQRDDRRDVHGKQRPLSTSASPRRGSSMLPARARPRAGRPNHGASPGLLDTHPNLGPTRPSAQEPRLATTACP